MTEPAEAFWRRVGLAGPARRALIAANILTLEDLARLREVDVLALHGMGPRSMPALREALANTGRTFVGETR